MVRLTAPRRHKHNAQKTLVDGIIFDSKLEARRYKQLELLAASGAIVYLELQPVFELQPSFTDYTGKKQQAIKYKADFRYVEDGETVIEEVKGYETDMWKVKKKMFLYHFPLLVLRVLTKEDIG